MNDKVTDVFLVKDRQELETAFEIRKKVFIDEQEIAYKDEFDEFDDISHHYLAVTDGVPCGTARWRKTEKGIKLERFAVLSAFRREGVGSALIRAALNDIVLKEGDVKCYLHAQKEVIGLYAKFGFQKVGKEFPECGIIHQTMEKTVME